MRERMAIAAPAPSPPVQAQMKRMYLLDELRHRPFHRDARRDFGGGKGTHRSRRHADFGEPGPELPGRDGEDDAAETDPTMRGRAHGTMLARCIDRCSCPFCRRHMGRSPARQLEFRMTRLIAA